MNSQQYRHLLHAAEKVEELERRLAGQETKLQAACEVFEILLSRGKGRPTKADVERLEAAQERMHGPAH